MGERTDAQRFQRLSIPETKSQLQTLTLLLCGAGSSGVYLLLTLSYPLEQDILFPLASIGSLSHYAPEAAALFGLCMALVLLFYLSAYRALRRAVNSSDGLTERAAQLIVIFPVLAMLILAHLYPITSLDSINQAIQARVLVVHHANPLLVPAAHFSADPFTAYDDARHLPTSYGPLWLILSAGPALLAGNNLLALVLLEKMVPILFALGCLRLVWLIATQTMPYRRWQALLLFGWNPLLLIETAGNGHNDSALLFFLLLAFYCLIAGQRWPALPALALATLVNSAALIFLPLLVVTLWRAIPPPHRALITIGSSTGMVVILVAAVLPFGGTEALASLLQPLAGYAVSLPAMLYAFLQPLYGEALADGTTKALAIICFGCWYLVLLYRLLRRNSLQPVIDKSITPGTLLTAGYEVTFWFFVLAALAFHPWMTLWLLPFAALDARLLPWIRSTLLTASALLVPIMLIFISNGALVTGSMDEFTVQLLAALTLFAPVLVVYSVEIIYQRRRLMVRLAAREAELARLRHQLQHMNDPNPPRTPEKPQLR